jgi:ribokinase
MTGNLVVVGSANQDYVISVDALPEKGETRLAQSLRRYPGGKGANQAVAAARLGAEVTFVGSVGEDSDGSLLIRELRAEGVETSEIEITSAERTGLAIVSLLPNAESALMVVPGANYALSPARAARVVERVGKPGSILVVQGEIRADVITAVLDAAQALSIRCVLNLSPFVALTEETLRIADPLILNGVEASAITGFAIDSRELAEAAADSLLAVAPSVVVVVGRDGAFWADQQSRGYITPPDLGPIVDTTGAADAFVGGVATRLSEGASLETAVRLGVEVGTIAMSRVGAQASYPYRRDVRQLKN